MSRPLHAIIDNLSCVAPSCFARDHHTFDSERWQTKATFDILEGLVQHCSTFNFCSGKPLAAPLCVTSLGAITVLRLHDAWDGATSLAWALEHLVELLNEAERTVDPSSPGRIIIVSNVLLAASSRKHSDDAVETMSVHRYCELSAMHKQDDVKSVDRGDARDVKDLMPTRLKDGFSQMPFTQTRAGGKTHRWNQIYSSNKASAFTPNEVHDGAPLETRAIWSPVTENSLSSINFGVNNVTGLPIPDARNVCPSAEEGSHILRTLFRWRGLRPQRDLVLVGLCADPQNDGRREGHFRTAPWWRWRKEETSHFGASRRANAADDVQLPPFWWHWNPHPGCNAPPPSCSCQLRYDRVFTQFAFSCISTTSDVAVGPSGTCTASRTCCRTRHLL